MTVVTTGPPKRHDEEDERIRRDLQRHLDKPEPTSSEESAR